MEPSTTSTSSTTKDDPPSVVSPDIGLMPPTKSSQETPLLSQATQRGSNSSLDQELADTIVPYQPPSTVPHEDHHDDPSDIGDWAARLQTTFESADWILHQAVLSEDGSDSHNPNQNSHSNNLYQIVSREEDDDLRREMNDLAWSEQLLRQELEAASSFSDNHGSLPWWQDDEDEYDADYQANLDYALYGTTNPHTSSSSTTATAAHVMDVDPQAIQNELDATGRYMEDYHKSLVPPPTSSSLQNHSWLSSSSILSSLRPNNDSVLERKANVDQAEDLFPEQRLPPSPDSPHHVTTKSPVSPPTTTTSSPSTTITTALSDKDSSNPSDTKETNNNDDETKAEEPVPAAVSTTTTPAAAATPQESPSNSAAAPSSSHPPPVAPATPLSQSTAAAPLLTMGHQPVSYQLSDHQSTLEVSLRHGWYSVNLNRHVLRQRNPCQGFTEYCIACPEERLALWLVGFTPLTPPTTAAPSPSDLVEESPTPPRPRDNDKNKIASKTAAATPSSTSEAQVSNDISSPPPSSSAPATPQTPKPQSSRPRLLLPVRTVTFRIRPDVLVGAVMDAIATATLNLADDDARYSTNTTILKRQGGHFKALVETNNNHATDDDTDDNELDPLSSPKASSNPIQFLADAQVCTHKTHECERVVLLRIFYVTPPPLVNDSQQKQKKQQRKPKTPRRTPSMPSSPVFFRGAGSFDDEEDQLSEEGDENNSRDPFSATSSSVHLQEACALVQRMEIELNNKRYHAAASDGTPRKVPPNYRPVRFRPIQSPTMTDRDAMTEVFSKSLRKTYKACPSVLEGGITIPALNSDDYRLIQISWPYLQTVWEELESRSLTFPSLLSTRFGSFPCLPTLDVHFCSQLRKYSRETMIVQLMKSATHLEEYALDREAAGAILRDLLVAMACHNYGVSEESELPPLPKALPLTSYQLEYTAPQVSCPPWGRQAMEALNHVQAWVDEAGRNLPFVGVLPGHDDSGPSFLSDDQRQDSVTLCRKSVKLVLEAFQKQDDEEKGARLDRKNRQVMERLSMMDDHQRTVVDLVAHCETGIAIKAANALARKTGWETPEVPLLQVAGTVQPSTSATCIVTAQHLVFCTTQGVIPYLLWSRQKMKVFRLVEIEVSLEQQQQQTAASALLLSGASTVTVLRIEKNGQVLGTFRPHNLFAERLLSFVETVKLYAK